MNYILLIKKIVKWGVLNFHIELLFLLQCVYGYLHLRKDELPILFCLFPDMSIFSCDRAWSFFHSYFKQIQDRVIS